METSSQSEPKRFAVDPLTQDQVDDVAERMVRICEQAMVEGASREQTHLWMRSALFGILVHGKPADESSRRDDEPLPWLPTHPAVSRALQDLFAAGGEFDTSARKG